MRLELYLGRQLLLAYALAALALGSLFWLLGFLQQLDQIGEGGVSLAGALWGGLMQVPSQLLDLLPVISVMATAGVIGVLQANRELTVLRMVGWTPRRLARVALLPLLLVVLLGLALSQWVTPRLAHGATAVIGNELRDDGIWHDSHGLWLRGEDSLLNVGGLRFGRQPVDINVFRLDPQGRVVAHLRAAEAIIESRDQWTLLEVREWPVADADLPPAFHPTLAWDSFLSGPQLQLLQRQPSALSLTELARYMTAMRRSGQAVAAYELALWDRLAMPFACLGMTLLAVALASGLRSAREGGVGWNLALALAIGLCYLLASQLVTYGSLLAELPTALTAFLSPLLLVLLGAILLARAA